MSRATVATGLTFFWAKRERFSLLLFACVFLSLVAHAATFFLFQVVYPERVTIPTPESRITLLTAATPEGEALLRWIDAEDPALVASATGQAPARLLDVPYVPSYAAVRTLPRATSEAPTTVQFPPAKPPLALIRSAEPKSSPPALARRHMPTSVQFSGALADRAPAPVAPISLRTRATVPLEPGKLLIGVNEAGEVRYHFLQQSSGNAAIDAQAGEHLAKVRFSSAALPIVWAVATITWGDDAYEPAASNASAR